MANGRRGHRRGGNPSGRDPGGFVALPWSVLDSPAWQGLSHPARSLLLEVARQYVRDNNGRLLASSKYLATRGWNSRDTISRAKSELIEAGFLFETVKGHRPNRASWFAVTWNTLDRHPDFDAGAAIGFDRLRADLKARHQNAPLGPPHGLARAAIGPPHGLGRAAIGPPHGPIRPAFEGSPRPPDGHHLEKPSTEFCAAGAAALTATKDTA